LYAPTIWDVATFVGSLGLFVCFLFLFSRFLPMVAVFEVKQSRRRTHVATAR
jgi:molybdopterin-containing oxidoreductase family membrane subunit